MSALLCLRPLSYPTLSSILSQVFMLLFSRYFQFADVRYYTLTAVAAIAQDNSGGSSGAKPASASATAAAADKAMALPAAVRADLPRNLFDTLEHVPETVGGESGLTSWCGATEVRGSHSSGSPPLGKGGHSTCIINTKVCQRRMHTFLMCVCAVQRI